MKIDRLRAFMTRDKDRPRVVSRIDTDEGLTGWGECYNHGPDKALLPLLDYLMTFLKGQDPRADRVPHPLPHAADALPAGRAGARRHLGHRPLPVGHLRQGAGRARLHAARRQRARQGARSMPASTPRPTRRGARRVRPAERAVGPHRLQALALPHRHARATAGARWCAPRRVFPAAARDGARPTTRSPSTRTPRSSSRRRPCSSATRSRPTIRCSSRSRSGPRTSRPGAS